MAIIQNLEAFVQSYPAGLDSVTDLQLSQNENGRQIRFTIGGVTIPAGSVATISGTKPDGVVYSNTGTIEGDDTVIFDEDVQMTAVFGTWYAKIRITNAGNTIASARVRFIIDKDPVDAGAIPSESQLDGLVAEAEEYAEAAEDAAERAAINYGSPLTASTASAMTDINRVYVYTGSESVYTYGNWYYYNGSAWVSGGVYNSASVETDTTLTEQGVPADAKATGDEIAELKDNLDQFIEDFGGSVDDAVDFWLDEHPEATTTVLDGSLTLVKFESGQMPFVTPEQFGAKGDGETDDTQAWQDAVDSGFSVKATSNAYKCGKITVSKNITIDCNNAVFTCTEDKLFYCAGSVIDTLESEADYTANQVNYSISDESYSDYTGMAMLKGTNNFEKSRDYYRGGFVCKFFEGVLSSSYPIDVDNVSIEIIQPITVHIKNIGDIFHSVTSEDYTITFYYGIGCTLSDSNIKHSGAYNPVFLFNCLECVCYNLNIEQEYTASPNDSYIIALSNSSFCCVRDCYLFNKNWHCITTGNVYLCYHNLIDNCVLMTDASFSYEDHENALNTIIRNSTCAGIGVSGLATIENCNIISNKDTYKHCLIRIMALSNRANAVYNITNIKFFPDVASTRKGIAFVSSNRVASNTYYIKQCRFNDVLCMNTSINCEYYLGFSNTSQNKLENIIIDNSNFAVNIGKYQTDTHVDITGYVLSILNCLAQMYDTYYITVGNSSGYQYNILHCKNSRLHRLVGQYVTVNLDDVEITQTVSGLQFIVSTNLLGTNIKAAMSDGVTTNPTNVRITDTQSSGIMIQNLFSAYNSTKKYYQYYNADGTKTTLESSL